MRAGRGAAIITHFTPRLTPSGPHLIRAVTLHLANYPVRTGLFVYLPGPAIHQGPQVLVNMPECLVWCFHGLAFGQGEVIKYYINVRCGVHCCAFQFCFHSSCLTVHLNK